jgi:uncharacterized YigZ family protein
MPDPQSRYPIPARVVRVEQRVVNSRFIATIGPAESVEAAKAFIDQVRQTFPDATHHVYAYRIGYGASVVEGMSDDREPAGTAGRPALAVLRGADLGDVALVITRYFGGTKLGTGGLVRAYGDAARAALEALPRAQRVETRRVRIAAPYSFYERLLGLIAAHRGEVTGEDFAAEVTLDATLPLDRLDEFRAALQEASSGRIDLDLSAPTR